MKIFKLKNYFQNRYEADKEEGPTAEGTSKPGQTRMSTTSIPPELESESRMSVSQTSGCHRSMYLHYFQNRYEADKEEGPTAEGTSKPGQTRMSTTSIPPELESESRMSVSQTSGCHRSMYLHYFQNRYEADKEEGPTAEGTSKPGQTRMSTTSIPPELESESRMSVSQTSGCHRSMYLQSQSEKKVARYEYESPEKKHLTHAIESCSPVHSSGLLHQHSPRYPPTTVGAQCATGGGMDAPHRMGDTLIWGIIQAGARPHQQNAQHSPPQILHPQLTQHQTGRKGQQNLSKEGTSLMDPNLTNKCPVLRKTVHFVQLPCKPPCKPPAIRDRH